MKILVRLILYKLRTSAKDTDDFSIAFDSGRNRRDELARNKTIKGKNHLRLLLKDVFGFAEHQEKAIYGLGYKFTLTRNKDEGVLDKAVGKTDARTKINHIHWYVPHFRPSIQQKVFCLNKFEVRHSWSFDIFNDMFLRKK